MTIIINDNISTAVLFQSFKLCVSLANSGKLQNELTPYWHRLPRKSVSHVPIFTSLVEVCNRWTYRRTHTAGLRTFEKLQYKVLYWTIYVMSFVLSHVTNNALRSESTFGPSPQAKNNIIAHAAAPDSYSYGQALEIEFVRTAGR